MNEFLEIEYDEKDRKFLLEVYADGKEEIKDKIKIEKNTQGKKKKQKIKYMDLNENDLIFMNARFVCRNKNNIKNMKIVQMLSVTMKKYLDYFLH